MFSAFAQDGLATPSGIAPADGVKGGLRTVPHLSPSPSSPTIQETSHGLGPTARAGMYEPHRMTNEASVATHSRPMHGSWKR